LLHRSASGERCHMCKRLGRAFPFPLFLLLTAVPDSHLPAVSPKLTASYLSAPALLARNARASAEPNPPRVLACWCWVLWSRCWGEPSAGGGSTGGHLGVSGCPKEGIFTGWRKVWGDFSGSYCCLLRAEVV